MELHSPIWWDYNSEGGKLSLGDLVVTNGRLRYFKGCLSLLILLILIGLVFSVAYKRVGSERIKIWLTIKTLDNLKRRILELKNLDISSEEIERKIEKVKEKLREGKGNLRRLYRAMDKLEKELRSGITRSQVKRFLKEIMDSVEIEVETKGNRSP